MRGIRALLMLDLLRFKNFVCSEKPKKNSYILNSICLVCIHLDTSDNKQGKDI